MDLTRKNGNFYEVGCKEISKFSFYDIDRPYIYNNRSLYHFSDTCIHNEVCFNFPSDYVWSARETVIIIEIKALLIISITWIQDHEGLFSNITGSQQKPVIRFFFFFFFFDCHGWWLDPHQGIFLSSYRKCHNMALASRNAINVIFEKWSKKFFSQKFLNKVINGKPWMWGIWKCSFCCNFQTGSDARGIFDVNINVLFAHMKPT